MASRRSAVASAALLAVVLCAPLAAAAGPSAADRETARALMDEGRTAQQKGDLKAALAAYKGADAIMQVPTTGLAVARAHAALGHLVEARDAALAVTRIPVAPKEPAIIAQGRKAAEDLAAELSPRIPTLKIEVKAPAGVVPDVTVDDSAVPFDALIAPRRLNPGHHVVVAKVGSVERRAEVDLAERDAKTVALELPADVKPVAKAPDPKGTTTEPPPEVKRKTSPLVYVGIGVGGAGLLVGGVAGLLSMTSVSSAKDECRDSLCPPAAHSDLDSAQTWAVVSNIGFVVAGVGAATAVVGLVVGGKRVEVSQGAVRTRPYVGAGQVGVTGEF